MATLVFIPLLVIGVPYSALLAVFVFFGELIPMVGFALATIPALLSAFVFGGLSLALMVGIIYMVINFLENHVLYPSIMNRLVGVPSVIIVIAVIVGAELAGIWGVILSVPLSAVLMELASDVEKRKSAPLP
jgi:predicted PurR-regulated permease PerM